MVTMENLFYLALGIAISFFLIVTYAFILELKTQKISIKDIGNNNYDFDVETGKKKE